MTLEFQLTFDQYRDASIQHSQAVARQTSPRKRLIVLGGWIGSWIILGLLAEVLSISEWTTRGSAGAFDLFIPMLAIVLCVVPVMALSQGAIRSLRQLVLILMPLVCVAILIAMFVILKQMSVRVTPAAPTPSPTVVDILYPHIAWIVLMIVFTVYAGRLQRNRIKKAWDKQDNLHRPHTFDITVNGIIVTSAVSRVEYQWEAFPSFVDAKHMFLLNVSGLSFHIIPKSAFKSQEELEACRNMFKNLIKPKESRFEVLPATSDNSPN